MYKWNAEEYKDNSHNQKKWALELLSKAPLREDESVLDIGCGDGEITALIAGKVKRGRVIGIDSSNEMIGLAKQRFPSKNYPNLSFVLKDVKDIDFNCELDLIFSNACLHWVTDHLPVLKKIRNSLKPSGRILFQMGGKGNANQIIKVMEHVIEQDKWRVFFTDFTFPYGFCSPDEYREWLTNLGFTAIRAELVSKDMVHENKDKLASWVRTTWLPYTQRVPEPKREEFIQETVDRYIRKYPADEHCRIHLQMKRLEVQAEL
ncbi:MAG: methyltransferase domain-containing protein [Dehalococcoidia bacterium]|jgi:trans-aconitate methyltransferase